MRVLLRRAAGSAAENLGEIPLVVEAGHGGDLMDALRGIFGEQALGVIDAHVGEQIDVRHAERLFQHGAEIGCRDADGTRSGGLRVLIVDPLRPGEQQREARGRERAAPLQIGQQIVRHLVRAGYGQPDGRAGVRHGNRVAECVLHALRGEIVPAKPDGGDAGTRLVPGVGAFEQNKHTVDVVFPQHADKFGDADERRVAVEHDDLRLGDDGQPQRQRGVVLRAEVLQVKAREVNHAADAVAQAVFADNKIDRIQAQPPLTITPSAEKDKLNPEKLRQVC